MTWVRSGTGMLTAYSTVRLPFVNVGIGRWRGGVWLQEGFFLRARAID